MVQVVFVHGVANRTGTKAFENAVAGRSRRFSDVAFKNAKVAIRNPYWGGDGADPAWQLACVPSMDDTYVALGTGGEQPNDLLRAAAVQDFPAVVGSLSVAAISAAEAKGGAETLEAERLWAAAAAYAQLQPQPGWVEQIDNDEEFLARLRQEAEAMAGVQLQALGLVDEVKAAGDAITGGLSNLVNGPIARAAREKLTPMLALFIGDVFRYLKQSPDAAYLGGGRAAIQKVILADVRTAAATARKDEEKLVLVGHSMGGVILYDLLSDPKIVQQLSADLGFSFKVDLLLTIGSQVALFEELKSFTVSTDAFSAKKKNKVPRPPPVDRWWNCFDQMDVLSFRAEPVFHDVADFSVDTVAGVKDAHGAYFSSMMFYERLNARLGEADLLN